MKIRFYIQIPQQVLLENKTWTNYRPSRSFVISLCRSAAVFIRFEHLKEKTVKFLRNIGNH